jgi:hypothetical protein
VDTSSSPSISRDGSQVAFLSQADNLNPVDDDAVANVFLRNFTYGATTLVSRVSGETGSAAAAEDSFAPAISRFGDYVAFASDADNLSPEDDDAFTNVFVRQLPLVPPAPDVPPDLGSDTCSHHGVCGADGSGSDTCSHHGVCGADGANTHGGHAGHVTATGAPAQTLFGPTVQDVDSLFVLAQVHADAELVVTATVKLPRGGRATTLYRFKSFKRATPAHRVFRVRLKLAARKLRAVKRALKQRRRLSVKVVSKARVPTGGAWGTATRKIRLRD